MLGMKKGTSLSEILAPLSKMKAQLLALKADNTDKIVSAEEVIAVTTAENAAINNVLDSDFFTKLS